MSNFALRLPNSLMEQAKKLARENNTSINQLFATAIAEKIGVLKTEELINERGRRADIGAYNEVLDKIFLYLGICRF